MNVIQRIKEVIWHGRIFAYGEINELSFSNPHPWQVTIEIEMKMDIWFMVALPRVDMGIKVQSGTVIMRSNINTIFHIALQWPMYFLNQSLCSQ